MQQQEYRLHMVVVEGRRIATKSSGKHIDMVCADRIDMHMSLTCGLSLCYHLAPSCSSDDMAGDTKHRVRGDTKQIEYSID
jgi:hypothetical protein